MIFINNFKTNNNPKKKKNGFVILIIAFIIGVIGYAGVYFGIFEKVSSFVGLNDSTNEKQVKGETTNSTSESSETISITPEQSKENILKNINNLIAFENGSLSFDVLISDDKNKTFKTKFYYKKNNDFQEFSFINTEDNAVLLSFKTDFKNTYLFDIKGLPNILSSFSTASFDTSYIPEDYAIIFNSLIEKLPELSASISEVMKNDNGTVSSIIDLSALFGGNSSSDLNGASSLSVSSNNGSFNSSNDSLLSNESVGLSDIMSGLTYFLNAYDTNQFYKENAFMFDETTLHFGLTALANSPSADIFFNDSLPVTKEDFLNNPMGKTSEVLNSLNVKTLKFGIATFENSNSDGIFNDLRIMLSITDLDGVSSNASFNIGDSKNVDFFIVDNVDKSSFLSSEKTEELIDLLSIFVMEFYSGSSDVDSSFYEEQDFSLVEEETVEEEITEEEFDLSFDADFGADYSYSDDFLDDSEFTYEEPTSDDSFDELGIPDPISVYDNLRSNPSTLVSDVFGADGIHYQTYSVDYIQVDDSNYSSGNFQFYYSEDGSSTMIGLDFNLYSTTNSSNPYFKYNVSTSWDNGKMIYTITYSELDSVEFNSYETVTIHGYYLNNGVFTLVSSS